MERKEKGKIERVKHGRGNEDSKMSVFWVT